MKRILDSVHGYIIIPDEICNNIIDTEYFQRLRRIEQTSGRSIFPSARHDRFIHSLGVYHLGHKIVEHLKAVKAPEYYISQSEDQNVFDSYELACLLHDICHSPFSHTFEKFFGKEKLRDLLNRELNDETFSNDWNSSFGESAPHEIMSAYMVLKIFNKKTDDTHKNDDFSLIVRMIVGCPYSEKTKQHSFRNAMIELIHGKIIDADGLDYVCRDAWASGYSTNEVDVERLIESIEICKNRNDEYQVCYTSKAQNAIESVLSVKTFQQFHVITHHKVVYEQHLLIEAMKSAALFHLKGIEKPEDSSDDERSNALYELCDVELFYTPKKLLSGYILFRPTDDDFVAMMKAIPDDRYVRQWFSRKYDLKPLWKSRAEFFWNFQFLKDKVYNKKSWIFSDSCRKFISQEFHIPEKEIWLLPATPKDKKLLATEIKINVKDEILPLATLFGWHNAIGPQTQSDFLYIYVPSDNKSEKIVDALAKKFQEFIFSPII